MGLSALSVGAQPVSQKGPLPVLQGSVETLTRVLLPGDELEIHIATLPELEKKYVIRADGTFFHPMAGEVKAAGTNLKQLEALLSQKFKKELRNPSFRIGLTAIAETEASVLGEVKSQGKFKCPSGTSVMDLLAQAGGLSEKADPDNAILYRDGKEIPLRIGATGQAEMARLMVRRGDILYVSKGNRVGVSGEVQEKGVYAVSTRSTHPVADALKAAGGPTENAALGRVQIIRPALTEPLIVNLLDFENSQKIVLEDGDVVLIPPRRAVVMGAVTKQGALPLTGSETLVDVLSQAGIADGRLDAIVVVRSVDVIAGNDKKEVYNLEEAFGEGKIVNNVPVRDGDVVFVPAKDKSELMGGSMLNLLLLARSFFAF